MELTQDYVRECFEYNKDNGALIWKTRPVDHFNTVTGWKIWAKQCEGKSAGHTHKYKGYRYVKISSMAYMTHRVIWLLVHGEYPNQIDHINGIRNDNRLDNLRNVDQSTNQHNAKLRSDNTSGQKGVCWNKRNKKWVVKATAEGKEKVFGYYDDFEIAVQVYQTNARTLGYTERHIAGE